jgi:hypothetical protein
MLDLGGFGVRDAVHGVEGGEEGVKEPAVHIGEIFRLLEFVN